LTVFVAINDEDLVVSTGRCAPRLRGWLRSSSGPRRGGLEDGPAKNNNEAKISESDDAGRIAQV